jgi:toxin ParE1/3/4
MRSAGEGDGKVTRTPQARDSIREVGRYIAEQSGSLDVALRFLDRIEARCKQHARSPLLGELCADLGPDVRCFYVGSYVVYYRPTEEGILVLLVIHSARDIGSVYRRVFGSKDD